MLVFKLNDSPNTRINETLWGFEIFHEIYYEEDKHWTETGNRDELFKVNPEETEMASNSCPC